MNRFLRTIVVLFSIGIASYAAPDTATKPAPRRRGPELIFDKNDFISRLPKKTLICQSTKGADGTVKPVKALEDALKILGDNPGVEFVMLAKDVHPPIVTYSVKPHFPRDLLRDHVSGEAIFLVLVATSGKVAALYCASATEKEFGMAGAACLLQFSFTPSEVGGVKLPVLMVMPVTFTTD